MSEQTKTKTAHVKLDDEDRTIPAGPTVVSQLKTEFGLEPTDVLYLRHGNRRQLLGDHETVDVKSGLHFEAVRGGGVS
jgi:hypothetical protein